MATNPNPPAGGQAPIVPNHYKYTYKAKNPQGDFFAIQYPRGYEGGHSNK